ncbi:hypothetical protein C8J57DRAFT_1416123, partial [Mycena rebaudengoi]
MPPTGSFPPTTTDGCPSSNVQREHTPSHARHTAGACSEPPRTPADGTADHRPTQRRKPRNRGVPLARPIYIVSRYPLLAGKPIHSGPSSHADYTTRTRATRPRTEEQQPTPAACQNESRTHHAAQNQGRRPRPAQETSPPHILKVPRTHIDSTYHSPLPTYARCNPGSKRASKQAGCRAHLDGAPPAPDSSSHPPTRSHP